MMMATNFDAQDLPDVKKSATYWLHKLIRRWKKLWDRERVGMERWVWLRGEKKQSRKHKKNVQEVPLSLVELGYQ
jgi:hypothetical protein